jgi:AcrR family transcriptional regulator
MEQGDSSIQSVKIARRNSASVESARRTKQPQVRREQLLSAAERLFVGKGFAATTIDEIVLAAGVGKGTFYIYFSSKDDILLGLRDRFINGFLDLIHKRLSMEPPEDWGGRLTAWVDALVSGYLANVRLHDVVFHGVDPDARRQRVGTPDAVTESLSDLLHNGVKAGLWHVDNVELTAAMLFHSLHAAVDHVIAHPEKRVSNKVLVAYCNRFFRHALQARHG